MNPYTLSLTDFYIPLPVPATRTTAKMIGGPLPRRHWGKLPTIVEGTYWKGDGKPSRTGTDGLTRQMRRHQWPSPTS